MFIKEFEIRWNDLDANKHLANTAYTSYMSHTRMAFFSQHGFGLNILEEKQLGPVVFYVLFQGDPARGHSPGFPGIEGAEQRRNVF